MSETFSLCGPRFVGNAVPGLQTRRMLLSVRKENGCRRKPRNPAGNAGSAASLVLGTGARYDGMNPLGLADFSCDP